MNIFDAGELIIKRRGDLIAKPNVIPVAFKRLTIKSERINMTNGKYREGQETLIRLDTLRNLEMRNTITGQVDENVAIINMVDSNGADLGWCPVEFFFL